MSNIHLNNTTKITIQKGIVDYLKKISQQTELDISLLNNESQWAATPNLSERRQQNINDILAIVHQIHFSHEALAEQVKAYCATIGTGLLRRSQLRRAIQLALRQLHPKQLDRALLQEHQALVNTDLYQQILSLKTKLNETHNNFLRARTNVEHWKARTNTLQVSINEMITLDQDYTAMLALLQKEIRLLQEQASHDSTETALQDHSPSTSLEAGLFSDSQKAALALSINQEGGMPSDTDVPLYSMTQEQSNLGEKNRNT